MDINCIKLLDDFYRRHCDDEWEHFYGLKIETCDNPGWLLTLTDPGVYNILISGFCASLIKELSEKYDVIITYQDETKLTHRGIIVFGESLENILCSTAELISSVEKL